MDDCLVTVQDFELAVEDVLESSLMTTPNNSSEPSSVPNSNSNNTDTGAAEDDQSDAESERWGDGFD
eukprot:CAMPEP_0194363736 /NCGR_PEP_ID=MMETSP0174-20130528/11593_1 /TAXON_ID=216777 /ORGANISM="Proboscia alata, Strain PI-D3" /LENGTH=66 /DNA_ID=CAMNT_0039137353 /DNA_START=29 /DNA_END=229 /DNA_ORIENTATION=-